MSGLIITQDNRQHLIQLINKSIVDNLINSCKKGVLIMEKDELKPFDDVRIKGLIGIHSLSIDIEKTIFDDKSWSFV